MSDVLESIEKMTAIGNRLELPANEHFSNYAAVKKALIKAGGKYKKNGFEFNDDASVIKDRLTGGEVVDDKKKFQFFPTPRKLAERMVEIADIGECSRVLEPSAGRGSLAFPAMDAGAEVHLIELMDQNCAFLRQEGVAVLQDDFLAVKPIDLGKFDVVIANPPFTKNQDIDHIKHMYEFLEDDGVLVSLSSTSWVRGSQKKQIAFREWLEELEAEIIDVPAGEFKDSGTNVATKIIVIRSAR